METCVSRLEEEMREEKATRVRVEGAVLEIKTILTTVLSHLATKADIAELRAELRGGLAEKPSKTYMWGVLAVLLTLMPVGWPRWRSSNSAAMQRRAWSSLRQR
jgi:hypothetical protein